MPGKKGGGGGGKKQQHADPEPDVPADAPLEDVLAAAIARGDRPANPLARRYADALHHGGPVALWSGMDTIVALLTDKKEPKARRVGCQIVKHLAQHCGPIFEPVGCRLVPLVIELLGDKGKAVIADADEAQEALLRAVFSPARPATAAVVVPALIAAMRSGKWEAREVALDHAAELAKHAPEQVAAYMPELVPIVTDLLHDVRAGVVESAKILLKELFACVTNRDFIPFKPHLSVALQDPEKVPSCITAMASTTFVSTVNRPELSLVVPLLVRGFRERGAELTPMVRKCAKITENLTRLVEEPREAELMLPELIPSLQMATDVVADKECRGVCEKALQQLERIRSSLKEQQQAPARDRVIKDAERIVRSDLLQRIERESKPAPGVQREYAEHCAALLTELCKMSITDPAKWRLHGLPYIFWLDKPAAAGPKTNGDGKGPATETIDVRLSAPNTSPGVVLGADDPQGLLLKGVKEGSPGDQAGLGDKIGRRITHVNDKPVTCMADVKAACGGQAVLRMRLNPSQQAIEQHEQAQAQRMEQGKQRAAAVISRILHELRPILGESSDSEDEDADGLQQLCDCTFSLAYGTTILLHNTGLRLHKGVKYGLLGPNDCGKTTLMKAIVNGQVDGFPPASQVRTVYVEADIQGDVSHLSALEFLMQDPKLQGIKKEEIAKAMSAIGFQAPDAEAGGKVARLSDAVTSLSGGWRMKLALARAMLQRADILLMDEPTNHLDVVNKAWVRDYLTSLKQTTCIIVSHDAGFLDEVCTRILEIKKLKIKQHKGNLSYFVKKNPDAKSWFELKSSRLRFRFPTPELIESDKGGRSHLVKRHLPVMKMDGVTFTYPGNPKPTIRDVTVRVSMSSRIGVMGPNGAGKSTLIKCLTGERDPKIGSVWKHPNARIAYVAQHAFHHIERHLEKTPNEYIRWRYEWGEDKEGLGKETRLMTPEEEEFIKQEHLWYYIDTNDVQQRKRCATAQILELAGGRRQPRKGRLPYEYEARWVGRGKLDTSWVNGDDLVERGWKKPCKVIDDRIAAQKGRQDTKQGVTQEAVERHLENCGLSAEFGTHHQIKTLSGGQKVKVVLAAATWDRPQIIILDEPTNYLDRESLGALADAIKEYEGGILIVSHNAQFVKELCPETWVVERQADGVATCDVQGNPDWMEAIMHDRDSSASPMQTLSCDASPNSPTS
eukprot:TRINITY_DN176_c0_g4_i1.p1 TRINITY_DN176_c0_g4~~TRINITY_DN176_c0_g4_i1.p1  ORF type:complete len:1217 (+),score=477.68 TRINITY_DN176_c0_g4_i1:95-3652(+)